MSKQVPQWIKLRVNDKVRKKIETIQQETGIENWSDITRYCITKEHNRIVGSPNPNSQVS